MVKVIPEGRHVLNLLFSLPSWAIYAAPATAALLFFLIKWLRTWRLSGKGATLFMLAALAMITWIATL